MENVATRSHVESANCLFEDAKFMEISVFVMVVVYNEWIVVFVGFKLGVLVNWIEDGVVHPTKVDKNGWVEVRFKNFGCICLIAIFFF